MANIQKRIASNGATTYRVLVRLKGHPIQSATVERLTDARQRASSTESAILEGRHFEVSESRRRTVSELIKQYRADVLPRPRSAKTRLVHLDWWEQKLGRYLLADVRPALLIETRKELLDGDRTPSTVNRYCASLSSVFTWGVKELQWVGDEPFFKISNFDEPQGVIRFLSDEELLFTVQPAYKYISRFSTEMLQKTPIREQEAKSQKALTGQRGPVELLRNQP